jgi:hypothetical protein
VEIRNPLCAEPYFVSKVEFETFRNCYARGAVAIIGEQRIEIGEVV